jgi:hypothetical protein
MNDGHEMMKTIRRILALLEVVDRPSEKAIEVTASKNMALKGSSTNSLDPFDLDSRRAMCEQIHNKFTTIDTLTLITGAELNKPRLKEEAKMQNILCGFPSVSPMARRAINEDTAYNMVPIWNRLH